MFFTLFCSLLGILVAFDYLKRRHRNAVLSSSKIDGRPSLPFIGSALYYRGLNSENLIEFMRSAVRERGKTYYSWVLHQLVVFCADPKDMEVLLSSQTIITKNLVYDMLRVWLNDGLLLSTNKKWHQRRKIITPTFHFKILEQFVETFDKKSSILVEKLKDKADGKTVVDVFPIVCLTALDIITESAMGVQVNAQMNPEFKYVKAVKTVTNIIAERIRRPAWRLDWLFYLSAPRTYKLMMENIRIMNDFTCDVIEKRRSALQKNYAETALIANSSGDFDADDDIGAKKRMALLDVLLQATIDGKPLSNEDIREEVETFMFEGHDTTTSGISFTLYLISRHPGVQQRLFKEICDVIGPDKSALVGLRQLQDLKFMECVIKESMRLFPPVPMIGRYFPDDVKINDKIIPGDTHVNIPFFIILRDPDYFPDPDTFKPERFEGDNIATINPFAYTPFSAGPRNCIGQKYSLYEMKSTISKILRNYELLPLGPEVRPSLSLVLRSTNGMNMGLSPRVYENV